jgi:predicted pyridoxine 5'-phosphate oxidase superfamily flavin-nucleotide-binding protein
MSARFADIAFTPAVKRLQERNGSRKNCGHGAAADRPADRLGPDEAEFIAARDSFYMATVSETGWPYLQHRGGPTGFLKVLDPGTIAFADFRGNRQYVSTGNLEGNDRVALFLMDYANRQRLKVLGHAKVVIASDDPGLIESLRDPGYRARVERAVVIRVEAYDWNCRQHITQRFTEEELGPYLEPMKARIHELEEQLAFATSGP